MKNPLKPFKTLLYAGFIKDLQQFEKNGVTIGMNFLCLSIILINVVAVVIYQFRIALPVVTGAIVEILLMVLVLYLNDKRKFETAKACMFLTLNAATFYFYTILGQRSHVYLMLLFLAGLTMFIYKKFTERLFCLLVILYLLFAVQLNFTYKFLPFTPGEVQPGPLGNLFAILVVGFLVVCVFYFYAKGPEIALYKERIKLSNFELLLEETRLDHQFAVVELQNEKENSEQLNKTLEVEKTISQNKTNFMGRASHELKGQHTRVKLTIEELIKSLKNEDIHEALRLASSALIYQDDLLALQENLLSDSVIKAGVEPEFIYKKFSADRFFKKEVNYWKKYAETYHRRIVYRPEAIGVIYLDKLKLRQILTNLINNALKFSPDHTKIVVRTFKDSTSFGFRVENKGEEIPNNKLSEIFYPYKTNLNKLVKDRANEGVGLGLPIAKFLIIRMHGVISVESNPNTTCFTVRFSKQVAPKFPLE